MQDNNLSCSGLLCDDQQASDDFAVNMAIIEDPGLEEVIFPEVEVNDKEE